MGHADVVADAVYGALGFFAARTLADGATLQAILFGVAHGYQGFPSIAVTGSYGLTLGILAWWRGNVRAGVLAHVATDLVGGLVRF